MNPKDVNRRKFRRAIFSNEDKIEAVFSIPGANAKPISVQVLNLSEGGMQFSVDTKESSKFKAGVKLILLQIKGPYPFEYLVSIDSEVKWVVSHQILEQAGVGCEFKNIAKSSKEQIGTFVRDWYERDDES